MLRAFHARTREAPVDVEAVERSFPVELHDPDSGEVLGGACGAAERKREQHEE